MYIHDRGRIIKMCEEFYTNPYSTKLPQGQPSMQIHGNTINLLPITYKLFSHVLLRRMLRTLAKTSQRPASVETVQEGVPPWALWNDRNSGGK